MAQFRKKPVVIEAWQNVDNSPFPAWVDEADSGREPGGVILIETLEGTMRAQGGDWLIKGVNGEVYPCKPDIFEKTYEAVTEGTQDAAWQSHFTERELKEIAYCQLYQRDFAHGTDGHNIRLIVAKLVGLLEEGVEIEEDGNEATS